MKLLIVEDNSSLAAIIAQLLRSPDRAQQNLEAITLAEYLQTAILCLPGHDVVLCDGMFPLSPDSRIVAEDWDVIRQEAQRRNIRFVLYSGSDRALDCARPRNRHSSARQACLH